MLEIVPNINLNSCCEEAINAYIKAFDAKASCLLRYSDADPRDWDRQMTPEQQKYIYHCELQLGDKRMYMSDDIDGKMTPGLMLSLCVMMDCKEDVQRAYEALREGSTTIYPMHSSTYCDCEVVFVDRFGIRWGLMSRNAGAQ